MTEPMAAQLARLLADSDLDELREIIARWMATAGGEGERRRYADLGARLVELKSALAEQKVQPTREELETALAMMMTLAAQTR